MGEELPQRKFIWIAILLVLLGSVYCFADSLVQVNAFTILLFGGFLLLVFIAFVAHFVIMYLGNHSSQEASVDREIGTAIVRSVEKTGTMGTLRIPVFEVAAEVTKSNGQTYPVIIKATGNEIVKYGVAAGCKVCVLINRRNGGDVRIDFSKPVE